MDEPIVETPVEAAPVETTPTETPVVADPAAAAPEPNDLEAYLAEQLKDEPAPVDPAAPVAPSDEFKQVLSLSEYVKEPAHVEAAVRAATEVWEVANGKVPASTMLEGMRAGNPQGFEKVVGDLIPYIEQITGKKFGAADANAAPDPVAELRAEIAAQNQQAEQQRQQADYARTVNQVAPTFRKAISETLGKQFGEGHEEYFIGRISQIVPEAKMVEALVKGDMKPLESAMKQVKMEELKRFKSYSDAITKQSKEFRKSLPAAKGGSVVTPPAGKFDMSTTEGRLAYANAAFNGDI
jgi:hypothetical protein